MDEKAHRKITTGTSCFEYKKCFEKMHSCIAPVGEALNISSGCSAVLAPYEPVIQLNETRLPSRRIRIPERSPPAVTYILTW